MKDRLVKATLEEMKARSLKFTMDDLARKLHASKSSIYKMVDSKESLIRLVMHWAMERFDRKAEALVHGKGPVNSRLMAFCGLFFKTFWYLPDAVNEDLEMRYEDIWEEWQAYREAKFDDMMALLKEGVDKGEYRRVNLPVVRQCVFYAAQGLTNPDFLKEMNMTGKDVLELLEDIMLKGLEKREDGNHPAGEKEVFDGKGEDK
ncbi:TetR/AcrR family transcriptional regulator [Dialister sp.]|uniref:TetR/AcrR family transcriptional regulator n=1 Tax=Dialister sp. TaxID=1955814 RepID=UPI003F02DC8E